MRDQPKKTSTLTNRTEDPSDEDLRVRLGGLEQELRRLREGSQHELALERERFRAMINSLPDDVFFVDTSGQVALVNDAVRSSLGVAAPEDLQTKLSEAEAKFEILGPDGHRRQPAESPFFRAFEGEIVQGEEIVRNIDTGELRHRQYRVSPVHLDGKLLGAISSVRDITENRRTEQEVVRAREELARDVTALMRIHDLSGRFVEAAGLEPLLQEIMDAAVEIMGAQKGTLQLVEGNALRIVAAHGHEPPFLEFFASAEEEVSACGEALKRRERIVVPDAEQSPLFAGSGSLAVLREAGVRAVQSTPMVSRTGALLGVLTTHWSAPHTPEERDFWRLDLLVRQAADLIDGKRAEELLLAERDRARKLLDIAGVMILSLDTQGRVTLINRKGCEILGHPPEEVLGRDWVETFLPEKDRAEVRRIFQEIISGDLQTVERQEKPVLTASGELRDIAWHNSLIRDEEGRIVGTLSSGEDITERKRSEEALRESEQRYMAVFENSPFALTLSRMPEGRLIEVNRAFLETFEFTKDEVIGKRSPELGITDAASQTEVGRLLQEQGFVRDHQVKRWTKSGAVRTLSLSLDWVSLGGERLVITTIQDVTDRARAEQWLRESESRFRAIFENATDAVIVADPEGEGRVVAANSAACRMFGYSELELIGLDRAALIDPSDGAVEALLAGQAEPGRATGQLTYIRKDGTRFPGELTTAGFVDTEGLRRVVVIIRDVSDRNAAEAAVRRSEKRLQAYIRATAQAVWTADRLGFSPEMQAWMQEFTGARLSGGAPIRRIRDAVHPDDHPSWEALWTRAADSKGLLEVEVRIRRKDGGWRWVRINSIAVRDEAGQFREWVGTITDVTEGKAAEEAKRRSEVRFGLLTRTVGRMLASDDPQAALSELCHEVMEQLDCQAFFNFVVDRAKGKLHLNSCAGIPEEEARRIEWLDYGTAICGCVARDGVRIIAEDIQNSTDSRANLVRGYGIQAYCCHPLMAQDRLLGTLSFGTKNRAAFDTDDVELMRSVADQVAIAMQRMQTMQDLAAANAQLTEADQRKNEFLAVLSHELRNPLAPIKNSLYIMARAVPGGSQARQAQAIIERQVEQLARLVDDLLDATRITRNKIQLQRQRVELNSLVQHTLDDYRSMFDAAGVGVEFEAAPEPIFVYGDPNRLAQTLGNLLQNAAKFTPHGGRSHVSLAVDKKAFRAVLRVADTGVGMAGDVLARLFHPFVQADATLDRSKGGLGLGLALVKGLVELHGGDVTANSEGLGRGSEFIVRLPLDLTEAEKGGVSRAAPGAKRRRVLIIEDNEDAAVSLHLLLQTFGHTVATEHDGQAGIAQAREFLPEVVLCDIGLPGMSGYEVARVLRSDPRLAGIHLVALSGYALPEDLERAAEAGFARHIPKPPNIDKLQELLDELPEHE